MSPEYLAVTMFIGVMVLVFAGVPLYLALGGLGLYFGIAGGWSPQVYDQFIFRIFGLMSSEVLPAVPMFVFMGAILDKSGAADKLFGAFYLAMGGLRGGLAVATILICTIFAACTGVVGASVTAMGMLALPAMLKKNYNIPLATGAICAGGTLGILIPPSVMMLLYGPMVGLSVAKMFMGAFIPGLVLSGLFLTYIVIICLIKPEYGPAMPKEERQGIPMLKIAGEILLYMVPPMFLILAVLGSIFLGVASPTEAAAMGGLGSIIVAIFYRKFNLKVLYDGVMNTLKITSMVMFVAVGAFMFSGVFMALGGAKLIGNFIVSLPLGKWGILLVMMAVIFILGMLIDWIGILFIVVPIFTPVVVGLGFDPLWFSLVVCVNLQMSFISPPFAYSIFYLKGVSPPEVTMVHIIKGVIPFVILQAIGLTLVVLFPQLILWLPSKM
ncbi:MAG: TRAP transporter large permease subunit [Thermodesulfobacteriota bacterium]|nr:TRAP transporter large permease subunit [Thermodesulfobacteriota bacterium]